MWASKHMMWAQTFSHLGAHLAPTLGPKVFRRSWNPELHIQWATKAIIMINEMALKLKRLNKHQTFLFHFRL
jgi:hypothetical protein